MSAVRYSGNLTVRVTYLESYLAGDKCPANRSTRPHGEHRCFVKSPDRSVTIIVGAPGVLSHSADSPKAFDEAAQAAIAFASHEDSHYGELAYWNARGIVIGRRPERRWIGGDANLRGESV